MKLEEVPEKSTPQYILINALDLVEIPYFDKSNDDYLLNGILIPVLAVIFMLKGDVKEGKRYVFLFHKFLSFFSHKMFIWLKDVGLVSFT